MSRRFRFHSRRRYSPRRHWFFRYYEPNEVGYTTSHWSEAGTW